jgi:hypothetical protein
MGLAPIADYADSLVEACGQPVRLEPLSLDD